MKVKHPDRPEEVFDMPTDQAIEYIHKYGFIIDTDEQIPRNWWEQWKCISPGMAQQAYTEEIMKSHK